jgi:two-component sensor histidine kinase
MAPHSPPDPAVLLNLALALVASSNGPLLLLDKDLKVVAASTLLRPYFTALCESIGASMIRNHEQLTLRVSADDSVTTADTSTSLGLIVTELVINALKHAFPDSRQGKILVDYHARGPNWNLSVSDDGVEMTTNPGSAKPGLRTSIVQALTMQLGGMVSIAPANPGTTVSVQRTFIPAMVGHVATPANRAA